MVRQPRRRSRRSELVKTLQRLAKNKGAVAGAIVLALILLMALFAPVLAPKDPIEARLRARPPGARAVKRSLGPISSGETC